MVKTANMERCLFLGLVLATVVFLVRMLSWEPITWDGWYFIASESRGIAGYLAFTVSSYFEGNPRIFHVVTLLTYQYPTLHLMATAVVEVTLLLCLLTLARGRLPRGDLRDSFLFVVIIALFWTMTPVPGQMLFYRPYATNYVYGAMAQLLFLVAYRLRLDIRIAPNLNFRFSNLVFLVLGFICGMANEHTGIAIGFGIAMLTHRAWLRGRLNNWMIAGGIGFGAGYLALLMAPGQAQRYGGIGGDSSVLQRIWARDPKEALEIIFSFGHYTWPFIILAIAVIVLGLVVVRSGNQSRFRPDTVREIAAYLLASLVIGATLLGSPMQGVRLDFAATLPIVVAVAIALDRAIVKRWMCVLVGSVAIVAIGYNVILCTKVLERSHREFVARVQLLEGGRTHQVVTVPRYTHYWRSQWYRGDDLMDQQLGGDPVLRPVHVKVLEEYFGIGSVQLF